MFENLRISNNSGIKPAIHKACTRENTITICIGIGGTGIDALKKTKSLIYEKIRPDNFERLSTEAPCYKSIRFLAIDSDDSEVTSTESDTDISEDFFSIRNINMPIAPKTVEWLNPEIEFVPANRGAGGIRQVGRYLLSIRAMELYNKFSDMVHEHFQRNVNLQFNINMMAGLGGGTGSGCFIDVCYIIHSVFKNMGFRDGWTINGFFFLPDVTMAKPNFSLSGEETFYLKSNSFAALKELDYLMNIRENGDVFNHIYPGNLVVENAIPPVSSCFLLSATNMHGIWDSYDGFNVAMESVAQFILNCVADSCTERNSSYESLNINLSSFKHVLQWPKRKNDGNCTYTAIGVSCVISPYAITRECLAINYFDAIKYFKKKIPSNTDIERFGQRIDLNANSLISLVKRWLRSFSIDKDRFDARDLKFSPVGEYSAALEHYCKRWLYDNECEIEKIISSLSYMPDSYEFEDIPESLAGKIFRELLNLVSNPDYGPYFASRLIDSSGYSLKMVFVGICTELEHRLDYAKYQEHTLYEEMCEAQTKLRSPIIGILGRTKEAYLFAVEQYYKNMLDIRLYESLIELLHKTRKHIERMKCEYFDKLVTVIDELFRIFEENLCYLEKQRTHVIDECANILAEKEVNSLTELDPNGEPISPCLANKFIDLMIKNQNIWLNDRSDSIVDIVDKFINRVSIPTEDFVNILNEDLGYGQIDYFGESIFRAMIQHPTFEFNNMIAWPEKKNNEFIEYTYISVPNNDEYLYRKARAYAANSGGLICVAKSNLTDQIFTATIYSGFSLRAYRGIDEFEVIYNEYKYPGVHLYEGKNKNWRNLPSPTSGVQHSDREISTDAPVQAFDEDSLAAEVLDFIKNEQLKLKYTTIENADMLIKDNILAVHYADGGAQGEAGAVRILYRSHEGIEVLYGNYVYGELNLDSVIQKIPVLRDLDSRYSMTPPYPFGGSINIPEGWGYIYMGAMNHFFAKQEVYGKTYDLLRKIMESGYNWAIFDATAWYCGALTC